MKNKLCKGRIFHKILAIFLSISLLCSNGAGYAGTNPSSLQDNVLDNAKAISIPEELGKIEEVFIGKAGKTIVYIQDAHTITSAQENIYKLIRYFQEKQGIRLVLLEGGSGKLDPTLFRTFPDPEILRHVIHDYLAKGELTGPQAASILTSRSGDFFGIEDWQLYESNYKAYLQAGRNQNLLLGDIQDLRKSLDAKRQAIYSPELNQLYEIGLALKDDHFSFLDFLLGLRKMNLLPQTNSSGWTLFLKQYPDLASLVSSFDAQQLFNSEKIKLEVKKWALNLQKQYQIKLSRQSLMEWNHAYQLWETEQSDNASLVNAVIEIVQKNLEIKMYPPPLIETFLKNRQNLSALQGTRIFNDLETFLQDRSTQLAQTPAQKALLDQYSNLV